MPDRTSIVAARAQGGIAVTVHVHTDDVMRVILSARQAALLGLDLLNLAIEPLFRLEAEEKPPGDSPGR